MIKFELVVVTFIKVEQDCNMFTRASAVEIVYALFFVVGLMQTAAFTLPTLERLLFRPKRTLAIRVLILTPTRELAVQYVLFPSFLCLLLFKYL